MEPVANATVVRLSIDGTVLRGAVVTASVRQGLSTPAQCAVVIDKDAATPGDAVPDLGAEVLLEVAGQAEPLFEGEIAAVEHTFGAEGSRAIRIRAYDRLHRLRRSQSPAVFEDVTVGELVRTLVGDCGLSVEGPDGPRLGAVYQHRRSSLQLLRDVTARAGLFAVVRGTTLRLVGLDGYDAPIRVTWGEGLRSANLDRDADRALGSVRATGWNADQADFVDATARSSTDLPGIKPTRQRFLLDEVARGADTAERLAKANLDAATSSTVTGRFVLTGDPHVRPGRRIAFSGLGADLDGELTVAETHHELGAEGYSVSVSTRPPETPEEPSSAIVTLGVVDDIDDPDHRGRLRVRLPALGDLVTPWAPYVVAGAGDGRGLFVPADEGDRVVVVLPREDPAQALVLGGLYGAHQPLDAGVAGGHSRRYTLQTERGQQLVLDGENRRLILRSEGGGSMEFSDEAIRITADTDLVLEAPGHALRLRARTVDFEEAP